MSQVSTDPNIQVASPQDIEQNPENPRLVFREKELDDLQASIAVNGILVPLTVYKSSTGKLVLLDGERRWRCAKKLGLHRVPIIVQPEPSLLQNIMMMFAIHNARADWDPLPTALKLQQLEELYIKEEGRTPTEAQLAQLASLSRGEVRRFRNILNLPPEYLKLLREEEELPRSEQTLTVDHLLELTRGAAALERSGVISPIETRDLELSLIKKFKAKLLTSTVEPRLLAKMARATSRGDVSLDMVRRSVVKLIDDPIYTINAAYEASAQRAEEEHYLEQTARNLIDRVGTLTSKRGLSQPAQDALRELRKLIDRLLGE